MTGYARKKVAIPKPLGLFSDMDIYMHIYEWLTKLICFSLCKPYSPIRPPQEPMAARLDTLNLTSKAGGAFAALLSAMCGTLAARAERLLPSYIDTEVPWAPSHSGVLAVNPARLERTIL